MAYLSNQNTNTPMETWFSAAAQQSNNTATTGLSGGGSMLYPNGPSTTALWYAQQYGQLTTVKVLPTFNTAATKAIYDLLVWNGVHNAEALARQAELEIARVGMGEAWETDVARKLSV